MRVRMTCIVTAAAVVALGCGGSGGPARSDFSWEDAVVYRLQLDRFADGDGSNNPAPLATVDAAADYRGGDLAGVMAHLQSGYFHDLGVNVLCLSSPADSATVSGMLPDGHLSAAYAGEWLTRPAEIDGRFGTMTQLQALTAYAHQHGIRVLVEHSLKHVHSTSPVYAEHQGWFHPLCVLGGSECPWETAGRTGWMADYLPAFDYTNAAARAWSVQQAVTLVTTAGLDGLLLLREDLVDPSAVEALRAALAAQPSPTGAPYLLLGEAVTRDPVQLAADVAPATRLDGQLDLPLRDEILLSVLLKTVDLTDLAAYLGDQEERYGGTMAIALGSPDLPRLVEFALDDPLYDDPWASGADGAWTNSPALPSSSTAFERAGLAMAVAFGVPGIPFVYYGDEVGLPGAGAPDNRRLMPWAGLTTDQRALSARIAALARVRAAHPALRRGTWSLLGATADTIAWERSVAGDTVYVLVNRSDVTRSVGGLPAATFRDELDGGTVAGPTVDVPPRSARFLVRPSR